jgi:phosphate-selective porin OprO/OprP
MKLKNKIFVAAIFLSIGQPVSATSEMETLINILLENNIITDAQYVRLQAQLTERLAQNIEDEVIVQKQHAEVTGQSPFEVSVKGAVTVRQHDDGFITKFGARVMADATAYRNDNNTACSHDVKRKDVLRLGL